MVVSAELFKWICVIAEAIFIVFRLDEGKTDVFSALLITFTA